MLKQNLAKIGLDVEIKALPPGAYFRSGRHIPGTPFDIALSVWIARLHRSVSVRERALRRALHRSRNNFARLDSPKYNALMRSAARLRGNRALPAPTAIIDANLARDVAPVVPLWTYT